MNIKKLQSTTYQSITLYAYLGLVMLTLLCTTSAHAQSLTTQKRKFYNGQYEEVFPYFKKKFKAYPNSANYNFFYGACCAHLGELHKSIKPLEFAVSRKTPPAYEHLIFVYKELYRFDDANIVAEKWIKYLESKRKDTDVPTSLKENISKKALMMRGISQVTILDSIVVDKSKFLEAYTLPESAGYLNQISAREVRYTPQIESQQWYAGQKLITREIAEDSTVNVPLFRIMVRHREGDAWSAPKTIGAPVNTEDGDSNYPYLMSDGQTLYYANNGEKSMGGYDLFVTRRMTEEGEFLAPQNMGLPFNSPANDYMLVIDTSHQLGWFASDRYQPDGMVCVYVFVPNETREVYDYDKLSKELLESLAKLTPISACRPDKTAYKKGLARLKLVRQEISQNIEKGNRAFTFVIDDNHTYTQYSEFNNPAARKLFKQYEVQSKDYAKLTKRLNSLRDSYAATSNAQKRFKMSKDILELENKLPKMKVSLNDQAKKIRQLEKK